MLRDKAPECLHDRMLPDAQGRMRPWKEIVFPDIFDRMGGWINLKPDRDPFDAVPAAAVVFPDRGLEDALIDRLYKLFDTVTDISKVDEGDLRHLYLLCGLNLPLERIGKLLDRLEGVLFGPELTAPEYDQTFDTAIDILRDRCIEWRALHPAPEDLPGILKQTLWLEPAHAAKRAAALAQRVPAEISLAACERAVQTLQAHRLDQLQPEQIVDVIMAAHGGHTQKLAEALGSRLQLPDTTPHGPFSQALNLTRQAEVARGIESMPDIPRAAITETASRALALCAVPGYPVPQDADKVVTAAADRLRRDPGFSLTGLQEAPASVVWMAGAQLHRLSSDDASWWANCRKLHHVLEVHGGWTRPEEMLTHFAMAVESERSGIEWEDALAHAVIGRRVETPSKKPSAHATVEAGEDQVFIGGLQLPRAIREIISRHLST